MASNEQFLTRLSLVVALLAMTAALIPISTSTATAAEKSIEYQWQAGPFTTNWRCVAEFPQFDPAFGELRGVRLVLESRVDATMQVENTSHSSPCKATMS